MGSREKAAVVGLESNCQNLMNCTVDVSEELVGRNATAKEVENK